MSKESTEYQNLIGEKVDTSPSSLEDIAGEGLTANTSQDWKDHWKGMPEFEQPNARWKVLTVQFRNQEDYDEFQKVIGQKLTNKTQGIWFPSLEKEENFLMRWIEDEES